jgi:hypothetical protein
MAMTTVRVPFSSNGRTIMTHAFTPVTEAAHG